MRVAFIFNTHIPIVEKKKKKGGSRFLQCCMLTPNAMKRAGESVPVVTHLKERGKKTKPLCYPTTTSPYSEGKGLQPPYKTAKLTSSRSALGNCTYIRKTGRVRILVRGGSDHTEILPARILLVQSYTPKMDTQKN